MKKTITAGLIGLTALTPSLTQASPTHRNKHHIASITFTKDKTYEITMGTVAAIGALGTGLAIYEAQLGDATFERRILREQRSMSTTSILAANALEKSSPVLDELASLRASKHLKGFQAGLAGTGVTLTIGGGAHAVTFNREESLKKLHAKDGETIHYRYDKNKSDKEVRTEIKRWLQKKSYLKGIKIKTDKFDHGTHTYTYKAADTWITVKL